VARRFGGAEMAPADFCRLIETIAQADGSAGWVASFGIGGIYLSALPLATLQELYAHTPDLVFAGGIFPPQPAADALSAAFGDVSFVEVRGDSLFVRTFERGVGLTDSCGSAMAASTYAACLTGRIAWDVPTVVFNRGGLVRAFAGEDGMVTLSGNATYEWAGSVTVDLATETASDLVVERRFPEEIAAWEAAKRG
jgi:hypothetical protein